MEHYEGGRCFCELAQHLLLNAFQLREDDSNQACTTERHLHAQRRTPAEHRECLQSRQKEKELFSVCHGSVFIQQKCVLDTPFLRNNSRLYSEEKNWTDKLILIVFIDC